MIELRETPPPSLPEAVLDRFPDLSGYNKQLSSWWQTVCENLTSLEQRMEDTVSANKAVQTGSTKSIESKLSTSITKLDKEVGKLGRGQNTIRETVAKIIAGDLP